MNFMNPSSYNGNKIHTWSVDIGKAEHIFELSHTWKKSEYTFFVYKSCDLFWSLIRYENLNLTVKY